MSEWLGQVPALLLALSLLVLPGLPVALCLRGVRPIARLGVAIAVSLGVIATAALAGPLMGMRWGLLPVAVVTVVVWAIAGGLRFFDRRHTPREVAPSAAQGAGAWAAVAVAFVGWGIIVAYGIGGPGDPSQLYDGLFHLNAVEFIAKTGDASPLHMTMVYPTQEISFYPTLWHAFVALIVPAAGSVVAATNVTTLAVIALIWPVALASLAAVAFPRHPGAAIWAPLVSFGFVVFPLGFLNWGVLYPGLLGTVLVPILLASVLVAFAPGQSWAARTLRILVALAAAGATALGHPSALLGAVALLVPYLLWRAWRTARAGSTVIRVVVGIVVLGGLAALVVVWIEANVTTHEWRPTQSLAQAFGEVAFLSPVGRAAGILLGPLAAIGIWRLVKDRTWWILASYSVSILLFLASTWLPFLSIRSFFVGVWYDDTTRVGALLAIWGLPLAALGASIVAQWLLESWRSGRRVRAVAVVALVAVAAATHLLAVRDEVRYMRWVSFEFGETSQGLSPDEAALFQQIDAELPEDGLVIGDPLTGAGLLYAYTGHDVVFPHVTGRYGADAALLARYLADGGPEVCAAAERLGVTHAFDFGDTVLFENHYTTYDGLHDLDDSPILTEVAQVGDAVLYELTGCE
ncbi:MULTISPECIES: DUF6541 family protein [unclassified Microbacterium]|uniref:DUF6541 family protein n=1 Tax=unclassified Microbacterium TaxID=2609290 RepID=UPI000EA8E3A7|nr:MULTISPECIES: DUF6541 family protein [unclassified Microbacterium]MBT2485388.1 hypothetical protein [Microbacterium sp. ISL-108]RKN68191.1 hypothetical protein D7252_11760 [Microbacterium sp. CGR2]